MIDECQPFLDFENKTHMSLNDSSSSSSLQDFPVEISETGGTTIRTKKNVGHWTGVQKNEANHKAAVALAKLRSNVSPYNLQKRINPCNVFHMSLFF